MNRTRTAPPFFKALFTLGVVLLLPSQELLGQKLGEWLRFAKEAKAEGDHHEAVGYLRKALKQAPERTDIRYKLAHALRRSHIYEDALKQYRKVQEVDRRGERFPKCLYYLAQLQEYAGKYREAGRSWGNLKRRYIRDKQNYLYKRAAQGARSCNWAQKALQDSADTEIERESYPINTTGSEFAPFIRQDSILYFTALRAKEEKQDGTIKGPPPKARILKAPSTSQKSNKGGSVKKGKNEISKTTWGEPRPIKGNWNKNLHMANSCFADSGKTLFFSSCREKNGKKICRIVRSRKKDGAWSDPEALPQKIVPDTFNTTHPMVGKYRGKEVLFFSSNRPGGKGKMDIWWVERKGNASFGKVHNAGDSINSPANEITPYYLHAERKLYFASDWHVGFGGYDLFSSKGKKKGFGEPRNLGYPINSSYNDLYPYIDVERNKGFFASNRKSSRDGWVGMCCNDLYNWPVSIEPRTDTMKIASVEDLNQFLPVTLYFHNDRPDPRTLDTSTSISYDASYRDYKERVPTYIDRYAEGRSGSIKDSAKARMKEFFDQRVDQGMQDLRVFSKLLLKELKKGQDIELTIKGYASPLAKTKYNVHLTKRRIASLVNYLQNYGEGEYLPYLKGNAANGGSLSFLYKPYGEYSADSVVSDELEDKQESVYSVSAALERKIEIERVKQVREDSSYAELEFEKGVIDLGTVPPDSTYKMELGFKNAGEDTLRIDSVKTPFEGLEGKWEGKSYPPDSSGAVKIRLKPGTGKGKQVRKVLIFSNGVSEKRKASVTYETADQR